MTLRVKDIMTTPVLTVGEEWPAAQAAELLARYGFTLLPVVDDQDMLLGVVDESDLLEDPMSGRRGPRPHTVGALMTTHVLRIAPDTAVAVLQHRMATTGRRAIPVVEHGRLVGIVTRRDLLRAERHHGARSA
jgi:CBS-domain-containing membrane protein